mmetsp:Transcript_13963/g.27919  ORF Transcript_13963/g.27919 Transcript_13963/m.27919 type:complete len:82 (+) Transcript_13963:1456-1701(+)
MNDQTDLPHSQHTQTQTDQPTHCSQGLQSETPSREKRETETFDFFSTHTHAVHRHMQTVLRNKQINSEMNGADKKDMQQKD